ncbi:RNA exonuclease 3 [Fusarium pseudocircinatum]|uniref:RNA exonuclease 3 n=1 Tax=Fusarium pseudocircinatum TaxID=56676 RepID=A0A8H5PD07_9HYPO|nr:RNA exonuclease 3 [Fusarium pseudocircinatum]
METAIAPLSASMLDQPSYLDALSGLVHSAECLASKSYVTARLTEADLEKKRRCARCSILLVKEERSRQKVLAKKDPAPSITPGSLQSKVMDEVLSLGMEQLKLEETRAPEADQFIVTGCGCSHFAVDHDGFARILCRGGWCSGVLPASGNLFESPVFGNVLIDKIVWPDVPMQHLNTKWSGVTWKMMHEARNKRKCVFGWRNARSLIWKFVGPETIVIGHGVKSDLTSLRWIHPRLIDTLIVEGNNRETTTGLSLKKLAEERLGRVIQQGKGHDSLEDAIATRDLLHWNVLKLTGGLTEA